MPIKQTAGRDRLGEFAPVFARLNDDVLFGEVWSREGQLPLKFRSIVTVSALIGKGITDSSLKHHLELARKNGVSRLEMAELLTHIAFYAGWPNAWAAFAMAAEVYDEAGAEESGHGGFFGMGAPNDGYAQYFSGRSWLSRVSHEGDYLPVFNVTFEPGCRNNWHVHHASSGGGQVLICVDGEGWHQEEGARAAPTARRRRGGGRQCQALARRHRRFVVQPPGIRVSRRGHEHRVAGARGRPGLRRVGGVAPHNPHEQGGFPCDTAGTVVMSVVARGASANPAHAVTAALATILVVVHAVWATVVLVRKNREAIARFHRSSAAVWTIWLIPCFCGMLMGVPAIDLTPNAAFGVTQVQQSYAHYGDALGTLSIRRREQRCQRQPAVPRSRPARPPRSRLMPQRSTPIGESAFRTRSTSSSPSRSRWEDSPSTCAPPPPRSTAWGTTHTTPDWTRTG